MMKVSRITPIQLWEHMARQEAMETVLLLPKNTHQQRLHRMVTFNLKQIEAYRYWRQLAAVCRLLNLECDAPLEVIGDAGLELVIRSYGTTKCCCRFKDSYTGLGYHEIWCPIPRLDGR